MVFSPRASFSSAVLRLPEGVFGLLGSVGDVGAVVLTAVVGRETGRCSVGRSEMPESVLPLLLCDGA